MVRQSDGLQERATTAAHSTAAPSPSSAPVATGAVVQNGAVAQTGARVEKVAQAPSPTVASIGASTAPTQPEPASGRVVEGEGRIDRDGVDDAPGIHGMLPSVPARRPAGDDRLRGRRHRVTGAPPRRRVPASSVVTSAPVTEIFAGDAPPRSPARRCGRIGLVSGAPCC